MLEAPEVEAHRHKTGHSHADLILGGLAVFLSATSVFIAVRHGETMERLVAANSWPNLSYHTGNMGGSGERLITLEVQNTGVGPARVDSFEVFYKDQPLRNVPALLKACCNAQSSNFSMSLVRNEVLPAREAIQFASLPAGGGGDTLWDALDKERFNVRVRACYCSVFEECWVMDSAAPRPLKVAQCAPTQPVQFGL